MQIKEFCEVVGQHAPDFGSSLPHEGQVRPASVLLHVGSFEVRDLGDPEALVEKKKGDQKIPSAAWGPTPDRTEEAMDIARSGARCFPHRAHRRNKRLLA